MITQCQRGVDTDVGVKDCYYKVCRVQCWTLWYLNTVQTAVSTSACLQLETIYVNVFPDDSQTDLARRCVAHPLGRVATPSLYLPTSSGRQPDGEGQQNDKRRQKAVGPKVPPAMVLTSYVPITHRGKDRTARVPL
jgi:hypothetical protein